MEDVHQYQNTPKELNDCWIEEILELETFFKTTELDNLSIQISEGELIHDCSILVETHLAILKRNNGKRLCLPYLNRLQKLKETLMNLD